MALKVFDLQCENQHVFEGWFKSQDNYEQQLEQKLLSCPVCHSVVVHKKLSAPRLNLRHLKDSPSKPASAAAMSSAAGGAPSAATDVAAMQAEVMRQVRTLLSQADNVGENFAEEARKMHNGEIEERSIRGSATAEECVELVEEGIAVVPIPDYLDDDRLQ
ncbi:DUF1178 family protein [Paenalcaligenes sp. Me131]|uniref:DUF1178 family protein n=1 Tax=Paenalcaligenes sp. Me131 TaxID=3392636 RepID=UPI003D2CBA61